MTCAPAGVLLPGESTSCTGGLTTTSGADVTRTATVTWDAESATSAPVTVTWTAALPRRARRLRPRRTWCRPTSTGWPRRAVPGPGLCLLGALLVGLGALLVAASAHEGL